MDDQLPLSRGQQRLLRVYRRRGATWLIVVTTAVSVLASAAMAGVGLTLQHASAQDWASGTSLAIGIPLVVAPLGSSLALRLLGVVAEAYDRLTVIANTDVLTGLANRRRFFAEAERRLRRLTPDQAVIVGMIDLNRFKEVNDSLGHAAGDAALVAVARRILAAAGSDSLVARLGGDEFCCLAPEPPGGLDAVERALATACARVEVEVEGDLVVSASVGVARLVAGNEIDAALAGADEALYRVKARRVPARARAPVPTPAQR